MTEHFPADWQLPHGTLTFPAFFPDATYGFVRAADTGDVAGCGISGLVMNTYHLMTKPGTRVIRSLGGLHAFSGWDRPILTDSGGFQVFSLIRENNRFGTIRNDGIIFRPGMDRKKMLLTPEKCIQAQLQFGSDIVMCLDYCTHPDDPDSVNRESVATTIRWAKVCRETFDRWMDQKQIPESSRPKLLAIVQGGADLKLRRECAEALIDIGFDGYGFGGWPMDSGQNLLTDLLAYTADLMPDDGIKYAMGIGKPEEVVALTKMGYSLFDCVIPTRDARQHRLTVFVEDELTKVDVHTDPFYRYRYLMDDRYLTMDEPVSRACDCYCCRNYSLAHLHHLFRRNDGQAYRLATIHNLRFYAQLMQRIRETV